MLFVTTLLFVVVICYADHHRPVWLPLLIAYDCDVGGNGYPCGCVAS